jgi:hypothetical protein
MSTKIRSSHTALAVLSIWKAAHNPMSYRLLDLNMVIYLDDFINTFTDRVLVKTCIYL